MSPAYVAASEGHSECLRELIAAGADVNAGGTTPWYVNASRSGRTTPLYVASLRGNVECVKVLVEGGAQLS